MPVTVSIVWRIIGFALQIFRPAHSSLSFKALCQPRYKDILAVDQISFSGEPGELVGYIAVIGLIMMVLIPYGFASFYLVSYLLGCTADCMAPSSVRR